MGIVEKLFGSNKYTVYSKQSQAKRNSQSSADAPKTSPRPPVDPQGDSGTFGDQETMDATLRASSKRKTSDGYMRKPMPAVKTPQAPNPIYGNNNDGLEGINQGLFKGKSIQQPEETITIPAKKKLLPLKKYPGKK